MDNPMPDTPEPIRIPLSVYARTRLAELAAQRHQITQTQSEIVTALVGEKMHPDTLLGWKVDLDSPQAPTAIICVPPVSVTPPAE